MAKAVLILACLVIAVPVHAATYYVDFQAGSGTTCSEASPCATVSAAQTAASAGDTVIVVGTGTGEIALTKSGTSGNPLTYQGFSVSCPSTANVDPHAPTTRPNPDTIVQKFRIAASFITLDCFRILPGEIDHGVHVNGQNRQAITVQHVYIDGWTESPATDDIGCDQGVGVDAFPNIANITVSSSYITGCRHGVYIHATTAVLEDTEIYRPRAVTGDMDYTRGFGEGLTYRRNYFHGADMEDCLWGGCHIDCFQTFRTDPDSTTENLTNFLFERNTCFNSHQGMIFRDISLGTDPPSPSGNIDSITVRNNVFGHDAEGGLQSWCVVFDAVTNANVYHNTCYKSGPIGYQHDSTGSARNNILHTSGNGPLLVDDAPEAVLTDNLVYDPVEIYDYDDNIVNVDPLLVDPENENFDLGVGSPAIGAGVDVGITVDRFGALRTGAADIGAFEGPTVYSRGRRRFRR